ncbi:DUF2442 domain-containing protein [Billgrantia sulfidoxydans]|uniref:DUF2442 domain-containing protein n=2 Tax=Billgrantia sulfidoxydans TaxID=2733484 RepID=A0ABX7WC24_9GAMM|nr:DUF2442 domain-containing protein [Halomonas sulfidoxydans]
MRSLREVGAIQREDLESFESTIGIPVETRSLEGDTHTAEIAFKALSKEDLDALATHTSPAWVRVSRQRLVVGLADGRWVSCPLEWFPRLHSASQGQLDNVELSPLGIHWPDVDEDISTSGLLAGCGDMSRNAGLRERFKTADPATIRSTLPSGNKVSLLLNDGRCLGVPLAYCTQTGD